MFHIKDNIYLSDKDFLLNERNQSHLIKNDIKRILICAEYIDGEILKNESLCRFLSTSRISIDWVFDTQRLIHETRFKMKGTEEFNKIRNELRCNSIKTTKIFKDLADFEGNILLVCNKMNKMSPVFCLLIENLKLGTPSYFILDALPENTKCMEVETRKRKILDCYNMLKTVGMFGIHEP